MNSRAALPTDLADLALAPVAIAVGRRLEKLGDLTYRELVLAISLGTDHDPVPGRRGELLLELLDRDLELHGWTLSWCPSGLRLQHHEHALVLGVAPTLRAFLRDDGAR